MSIYYDEPGWSTSDIVQLTEWASQECEWQLSGEKSVGRLVNAVFVAMDLPRPLEVHHLLRIGGAVDSRNHASFRQESVWVGGTEMPPWGEVFGLLEYWISHDYLDDPPGKAFKTFEEIHPFVDGNGRVGAILYNMMEGTLQPGHLQYPPNVFGDLRR